MASIRGLRLGEPRHGVPGAPATPVLQRNYATTGRRLAALGIDIGIFALSEFFWPQELLTLVGALGVGEDYRVLVAEAMLLFAYFAIAWSIGKSVGMRIVGIRVERAESEEPPGPLRGLIRAALGVAALLSAFALLAFVTVGEPGFGNRIVNLMLLLAALPIAAVAIGSGLKMEGYPTRQSLIDRAAGVVVVRVARAAEPETQPPPPPSDDDVAARHAQNFDPVLAASQLILPGMPPAPAAVPQALREARLAPKGTRFAAFALDCLLLLVTFPAWFYAVAYPLDFVMGDSGALLGIFVAFVTYFTVGWGRGQTPGMRLAGIRHQRADRGGRPGYRRGLVRALLGGTPPAALVVLAAAAFSDVPLSGSTSSDEVLLLSAAGMLILGTLARLTMFRDPRRQSLIDRAAGVVVVRAAADATPAAQAWQPALADGRGQVEPGQWPATIPPVASVAPLPPGPAEREQFALTGTRLAALFFDVVLLAITVPIWGLVLIFPLFAVFPEDVALAIGLIVGPAAYFAFAWGRGRTLGMRLLSIHLERADRGGKPGLRRGLVRSLLATIPVAGSLVTLGLWAGRFESCQADPACRPADDFPLLMAGLVLFGIALGTRLTMRYHPRHQSVIDRAAGVVVLLDAPRPRRGDRPSFDRD